jgi:hypothetical protein
MKTILCFVLAIIISTITQAQFLQNVFAQKAMEKKNQLQQIAALKIYMGYLEKGYAVAKKGLTTIGDINNKHFTLDKDFFASLASINPKVKNYARVADIISMNILIVNNSTRLFKGLEASPLFSSEEKNYVKAVCAALENGSLAITEELIQFLSANVFTMTDDERIHCIDQLYREMAERVTFLQHFANDTKILALAKQRDAQDAQEIRTLFELQ